MKKRNRFLSWLLFFALTVTSFIAPGEQAGAAVLEGGYDTDDPKGFFDLLVDNEKDALFTNGHIYFATKGKLATSTGSAASHGSAAKKTYQTIGYTITASAGGQSVSVEIATPGAFVSAMAAEPAQPGDVIVIAGVGEVYPFMRVHNILDNIQQEGIYEGIPVIVAYPGRFDGQTLSLFGRLTDGNYYRAFDLI